MRQERIIELLTEAARQDCPNARTIEILNELLLAVAARNPRYRGTGLVDTVVENERAMLISKVFAGTWMSPQRDTLPNLFPFFATVCGDLEGGEATAKIDWSVVEKYKK